MAAYVDAIEYVRTLCGATVGQLPANGGTVMQVAPSGDGDRYFDGTSSDNLSLLFLCKNKNQQTAISTLESVCNLLTRTRLDGGGLYSACVSTNPNYVSKEGEFWIYSCVIDLKIYNKEAF